MCHRPWRPEFPRPPRRRSPTVGPMASISSKVFTVVEHIPNDTEYRASRRFLVNPDCLKPFKLSAGEVVAIVNPENADTPVSL